MDTKWKNLINKLNMPGLRKYVPVILFISIAAVIFSFSSIHKFNLGMSTLNERSVFDSEEFYSRTNRIERLLLDLTELKNADYISSGALLDNYNLESYSKTLAMNYIENSGYWFDYNRNIFYNEYNDEEETNTLYVRTPNHGTVSVMLHNGNFDRTFIKEIIENYGVAEETVEDMVASYTDSAAIETVIESYANEIEFYNFLTENNLYYINEFYELFIDEAIDHYIEYDLTRLNEINNELDGYEGLLYYMLIRNYPIKNTSYGTNEFQNLPFYYMAEYGSVKTNADSIKNRLSPYSLDSDTLIMYGFEVPAFNSLYSNWQFTKAITFLFYNMLYLSLIVLLLSLAYILYYTGTPAIEAAKNSNGPRPGSYGLGQSRIYSDLSVLFIFLIFIITSSIIMDGTGRGRYWYKYAYYYPLGVKDYVTGSYLFWGIILSLAAAAAITYLFHCLIWDYKRKQLISHSLLYWIYQIIGNLISNISNKIPVGHRLVSARKIRKVKDGIVRIQEGDYSQPIKIRGYGHMAQIAEGINEISVGFNIAVENRIKSERLKTELISNVSHDIRTPLTSIITYVDLLKKEGNTVEETEKYLDVLENKTARLKILIDDLFEASKVSSGNIAAELMPTDLINVLDQAMGELEDKIEASSLIFKLGLPSEKIIAMADGKILWRIINNLFSNIFKYSMPDSRVYIDIFEDINNHAVITFKNMSAYELNISSDELMERFTRGDKSRNSEGSGLGLNIARNLTELMGGQFNIKLDGDLFKVIITLQKA